MDEFYTPLEKVSEIIKARWLDLDLREKIEKKLGDGIPELLKDGPSGVIWRQIGTPDGEFSRFLELNKTAGLKPACFEFLHDQFSGKNFTKYALTNLAISDGKNKNSKTMITRKKIIDFDKVEGKQLLDIKTLWGVSLVEFHHHFLQEAFPIMKDRVVDISEWARRHGETPKEYYPAVMSLALCHCVIFDDFDTIESEENFTNEVVIPTFKAIEKEFLLKPIIVRISNKEENDPFWWCYPGETRGIIDNCIKTLKC